MLSGTITQAYTWQWAADQSEASLTMHVLSHQVDVLSNLAADALKITPSSAMLNCTVKVLKALNICYVPEDRLNHFLHILKEQGLIPSSENDRAELLKEALAINNFPMAKTILDHMGLPNMKMIDPYEIIRKAMEKKNELLIIFILQNNLIHSRSLLKSIFGAACDKLLLNVVDTLIDKIPGYQTPQETIDYNLREALKKVQHNLVDILVSKYKVNLDNDINSKSCLLYYTCCLKPELPQMLEKILDLYKNAPNFTQEKYNSIINKACKKAAIFGNTQTVKYLIKENAHVDFHILSSLLYQREDEFTISLLEAYPQVDYHELLMIAIRVGADMVVAKLLTDFEPQILKKSKFQPDEFYLSLLETSFKDRNSMAAYFCIEKIKKPIPQPLVDSLIAQTIANESEGLLLLLIERRLVHRTNYFMFLMHSSRLGFEEATRLLLRLQVNLNLKEKGGLTPLMVAIAGGHVRIADMLLNAGAKIHATDTAGNTALHYGAYVGSEAGVKLLINRGALVNSINMLKVTPLHLAAEEGWENAVKVLLFHQADRLAQNEHGETPLHLAIASEPPSNDLIESLLVCNDVLAVADHQGKTPFAMLLKKNMLKNIRQVFFPFPRLSALSETITDLDNVAVNNINRIMSPHNLSYAVPLELALLLNNYPLAHEILKRYTPQQFALEMHKLEIRYSNTNLQMLHDAKYGLHPDHFMEGLEKFKTKENTIPVFPAALDFMKAQILAEFDKINFKDKTKPYYRNPETLRNDGEPVKPEAIKEGLAELFKRVKYRTPFLGTPPENSPELLPWYEKLERLLQDLSALIITKKEADEKASLLIEMGIAGLHCGGRWIGTLRQMYQFETTTNHILTLPEIFKSELQQLRQGILQSLTGDGNVHQYNHFLYLIGEELGLTPQNTRDKYKDTLADLSETQETLLTKFYKIYNPTFIIDTLSSDINRMAKGIEKRDILIDWFKENIPDTYKPGDEERLYTYIAENLYDENQQFKINRSAVIYMLQKFRILC